MTLKDIEAHHRDASGRLRWRARQEIFVRLIQLYGTNIALRHTWWISRILDNV